MDWIKLIKKKKKKVWLMLKNKTQLLAASKWLISALNKNVDSKWGDTLSKWQSKQSRQNRLFLFVLHSLSLICSLWPHGLQHVRLLCPQLYPRVCLDLCLLSLWCYLTISSSATPVSVCLHSFPASSSFPVNGLFPSGGQSLYSHL